MNTGNKPGDIRLVEIAFPLFAVNPAFENAVVTEADVMWIAVWDITVERIDKEWSELQVRMVITLRKKDTNKKIAELITVSTSEVVAGQSMDMKKAVLFYCVNETAAHAQGAWLIKNENELIARIVPQALDRVKADGKEIKDAIKAKWSQWSNK